METRRRPSTPARARSAVVPALVAAAALLTACGPATSASPAVTVTAAPTTTDDGSAQAFAAAFDEALPDLVPYVGLAVAPTGGGRVLSAGGLSAEPALGTVSVPLALAAGRLGDDALAPTVRASARGDVPAALEVWNRLGGGAIAAAAVQEVVSSPAGGTPLVSQETYAEGEVPSSATVWEVAEAASFAADLPCQAGGELVLTGMREAADSRWHATRVGTTVTAVASDGGEARVRELGVLGQGVRSAGVSFVVRLPGGEATAREAAERVSGWLADRVDSLPRGGCSNGRGLALPAGSPSTFTSPPSTTMSQTPDPPATPPTTATPALPAECPAPSSEALRRAPGAGKTVALTFDDGPGGATPQVRAILRRYGVRATFFDVGARSVAHADEEAALAADGHLVANHTWDHLYPRDVPWTVSHVTDQMRRAGAAIAANIGTRPCFFRPPGGVQTNIAPAARAQRLRVVMWTHDTLDWAQPSRTTATEVQALVRRATSEPGAHPIVLMHTDKASNEPEAKVSSYRGNTVAALPRIIEWYRDHGYRFVDVAGRSGLQ